MQEERRHGPLFGNTCQFDFPFPLIVLSWHAVTRHMLLIGFNCMN